MQVTLEETISIQSNLGEVKLTRSEAVDLYIKLGGALFPTYKKPDPSPAPTQPFIYQPLPDPQWPNRGITC
jgi:hypothetical protein